MGSEAIWYGATVGLVRGEVSKLIYYPIISNTTGLGSLKPAITELAKSPKDIPKHQNPFPKANTRFPGTVTLI